MTHYESTIARLTDLDAFVIETLMMEEHNTLDHLTEDDFRRFIGSIERAAADIGETPERWLARERAEMVACGLIAG